MHVIYVARNKFLKVPLEIYVDDDVYKEIEAAKEENDAKYDALVKKLVERHVKKYGYDIGRCHFHEKKVTLRDCLNCGIKRGQKKSDWDSCKNKNIDYLYPTDESVKPITDEKIKKTIAIDEEERRNMDTGGGMSIPD